jgi:hypothetical protein
VALLLPWEMTVAVHASLLRQRQEPFAEESFWQQALLTQLSVAQPLGSALALRLNLYARQAEISGAGVDEARQFGAELGLLVTPRPELDFNFGVSARKLEILPPAQPGTGYAVFVEDSDYERWHQPLVLTGGAAVHPHSAFTLRAQYRGGSGYAGIGGDPRAAGLPIAGGFPILYPLVPREVFLGHGSDFIHQLDLKMEGHARWGAVDLVCFVELVNATQEQRGDALGWQMDGPLDGVGPFASRALNLGLQVAL